MTTVIKISLRLLTVGQIFVLLTIAFGKSVGVEGLRMAGFLWLLLPVLFGLLTVQQISINKSKRVNFNFISAITDVLIIVNAIVLLSLVFVLIKDPIALWKSQWAQVIPVEPRETVYYVNPVLGILCGFATVGNWTIANFYFHSVKKLAKPFLLLSFSLVLACLLYYIQANPPHFPVDHG